jgi:hypothetical protein
MALSTTDSFEGAVAAHALEALRVTMAATSSGVCRRKLRMK